MFSKFIKNFKPDNGSERILELTLQDVSNDKYLKLYKIKSDLVDYDTNTLKNSVSFSHEDSDLFFGVNASGIESLKETYNDKYEYIFA